MAGWAEGPGGGMLANAIVAAFARVEQRDRDNEPCPTCGGDRLRTDFTSSGRCHAPMTKDHGSKGWESGNA